MTRPQGGEGDTPRRPHSLSQGAVQTYMSRHMHPTQQDWEEATRRLHEIRAHAEILAELPDAPGSPAAAVWHTIDATSGFRIGLLARHDVVQRILSESELGALLDRQPPVCSSCRDTHCVDQQGSVVMCTRCPVPCEGCRRQDPPGPYCASTPCSCPCHLRDGGRRG